jgi:outer membrane protein
MKTFFRLFLLFFSGLFIISGWIFSQESEHLWTLEGCIQQALDHNIQLKQMMLKNETSWIDILQAKAARYPSASASVTQNFAWGRKILTDNDFGSITATNNTGFGISSNMTLYNGFRINNSIKQSELNYRISQLDVEAMKNDLRLSVLDAYLQVLYSTEAVNNSRDQLDVTAEELSLAEERLVLGALSRSDFLLMKAQLANEKLTLTNAENQLALSKVTLLQLMEIPVSDTFKIRLTPLDTTILPYRMLSTDSVYALALQARPEIKSAALAIQSADLDVSIASAGLKPGLSLHGSLNSGYSSELGDYSYTDQLENKINPALGLSLTIPIYQNREVRSKIETANIGILNAQLNETNTKNQLRKIIEQACIDITSSMKEYDASIEKYQAQKESFELATEKFKLGLINSVDFLYEKTNLIAAESNLLQSKYKLIYNIRILDFYTGKPLTQ